MPIPSARRTLDAWCQRGLQFAIDDFGTGQASLSYLTDLPTTLITIDRAFIAPLPGDPQHSAIVEGVIPMAHPLRRPALAAWLRGRSLSHEQGIFVASRRAAALI